MTVWKTVAGVLLTLLVFTLAPSTVTAQEPAGNLAELAVDIWPDHDRPEVLVLLTGRLPSDTPLPATVTIPLPTVATLNAVARISNDNLMIDDIEFIEEGDSVVLVTPDARFRVEFYIPYQRNGDERQFTYRWLAEDLNVDLLSASIEQPAAADTLTVTPAAETINTGSNGLTYHNLEPLAVPAGEPYDVEVVYTADSDVLSVSVLQAQEPLPTNTTAPAGTLEAAINWTAILVVAVGVLVALAAGWWVWRNQQARPPSRGKRPAGLRNTQKQTGLKDKPAPSAAALDTSRVNFCHQCGQPVQPGDKFCRHCGTALKQPGS